MKTLVVSLIALSVAAGSAIPADASTYKKKRLHAGQYPRTYASRNNDDDLTGYYEHRLEAVRFGSRRWWKIYEEQNGGSQRR